ncbi:MAG: hypothetical protein ACK5N8_07245 [Alphaproteobacteria bacterium]
MKNLTQVIDFEDSFYNANNFDKIENLKLNQGTDLSLQHAEQSLSEKDLKDAKEKFCMHCQEHNPNCRLFILRRGSRACKELATNKEIPYVSQLHIWRILV